MFLVGDFNYPGNLWDVEPPSVPSSGDACAFVRLCDDFHFNQIVLNPTRVTPTSSNIPDLFLTTTSDLGSPVVLSDGLNDHSLLHFFVQIHLHDHSTCTKLISNYKKANFAAINDELCNFLGYFADGFDDRLVESNWLILKAKIVQLTDKRIPVSIILIRNESPWYNRTSK